MGSGEFVGGKQALLTDFFTDFFSLFIRPKGFPVRLIHGMMIPNLVSMEAKICAGSLQCCFA